MFVRAVSVFKILVCASLLTIGAIQTQAEPASKYHRATIHPSIVNLDTGKTQQFRTAIVATRLMAAASPTEVKWSVNDIPGGNAEVGTIDANGLYTAPASAPTPREIHIGAEVPEAANRFLFATVIIGPGEPVYTSIHSWSENPKAEDGSAHMSSPHGIGLDKEDNVLIADQVGNKVLRYSKTGEFIGEIGKGSGSEPGQFREPREVRSDVEGNIFVTDSKGDRPRVQVFAHDGTFKQIFAEKGRWQGMLLRAHGMGFDAQRRLFVVDVDNMAVKVYDKDGKSLYDWGTEGLNPGQFNAPHGLFVDRSGDVFVTGYYGPTQKFNNEGDFVTAFAHGDPPDGAIYFHSVSGDKWGNAYLSVRSKEGYDGAIQRGGKPVSIIKFNNNGDFVTSWAYSAPEHTESEVAVANDGTVYALFKSEKAVGVETFVQK